MALTPDTQTALANEVRRQSAQQAVASIQGQMAALGNAAQVISSLSQDAAKQYAVANQTLAALQVGVGPGITADFGHYTSIDQLLRAERFAGKSACVDAIKADPQISESDAAAAWATAALAATTLSALVVPVANYATVYRAALLKAGFAPDTTWESQRAWIVATDRSVIMGDATAATAAATTVTGPTVSTSTVAGA
jgi:hypothetical protein